MIKSYAEFTTSRAREIAKDMDIVVVCGGGAETAQRSLQTLREGGKLICVAGPIMPSEEELEKANVEGLTTFVEPDYKSLESLAELMDEGKLKVVIAEQRPFTEMKELHNIGKKGSPLGKLVATVNITE